MNESIPESDASRIARKKYTSFILVLITAIILLVETLILFFSNIYQLVFTNLFISILSTTYLFYGAAAIYRNEKLKGLLASFIFAGILVFNAWQYVLVINSGGIGTVMEEYLAAFFYVTISVICLGIFGGFMAIVEMKQSESPQGWNSLSKRDKAFIIMLIICTPIISALLLSPNVILTFGNLPAFQIALILSLLLASFAFAKPGSGGGGGFGSSIDAEGFAIVIGLIVGIPLAIVGIAIAVAQKTGEIISSIPGFEPFFFLTILAVLSAITIAGYRSRLKRDR
nr:hypothetical protein [Candidatus Sigynarchaeota archaeon]